MTEAITAETKLRAPSRCGGCTLCCDLLEVKLLGKSANAACSHCTSGDGCAIWDQRPSVCRRYICLWHANPKFPDALRPDRCGALFEPVRDEKIVIVNVDLTRPHAWRLGVVDSMIRRFLAAGTAVVVIVGAEKHMILPEGVERRSVLDRLHRGAQQLGLVV